MKGEYVNPYALYVKCDAGMDRDSRNTGGIGLHIVFPEHIEEECIDKSIGRYEGANIERLELEAIIQGMKEVVKLFNNSKLNGLKTIIFTTDRFGLNDKDKTSPYRIRQWRKDGWKNHEGKSIKNSDLLDELDKTRTKIAKLTNCYIQINYGRRKFNKAADNLAERGKTRSITKDNIALEGIKIGKRKYGGENVDYKLLNNDVEHIVHVFKKEPVRKQWEISVEFCEGIFFGKKLNIYTDATMEDRLHRHHQYHIKIKKVFTHHVVIYRTIKEIKN